MCFVYLRISGDDLDPQKITEKLKIQPSFICKKGADIKNNQTRIYDESAESTYKESCWVKKRKFSISEDFNKHIGDFLDEFSLCSDIIRDLSALYTITLWITIYPDREQINKHLNAKVINTIAKLGIDIDLTIMSLQSICDGTYLDAPYPS